LQRTQQAVRVHVARLDGIINRLQEKENRLFAQVVSWVRRHEQQRAAVYANEVVQLRHISRMVVMARAALDRIMMRIDTIHDVGDFIATLGPAVVAIRSVRADLLGVVPEAERSFSDLSNLLSGVLLDAGQAGGTTLNFEAASEDAERILSEASAVAEQRLKERFPDLPVEVQSTERQPAFA
jgi:division protein CdvB (Snf7/Vps24/ESCRT-III family)